MSNDNSWLDFVGEDDEPAKESSGPASPTTPDPNRGSGVSPTTSEWYQETLGDAIDSDDLPDVVEVSDREVEANLERLSIEMVYRKYGKGDTPKPKHGKQGEHDARCPLPSHPDANPSAGFNTNDGTWHCFGCDKGGDKFTLAGYIHNMDPSGPELPALKRKMISDFTGWPVEDYGNFEVVRSPAVDEVIKLEEEQSTAEIMDALDEMFDEGSATPAPEHENIKPLPARSAPAEGSTALDDDSDDGSLNVTPLHQARPVEESKQDPTHLKEATTAGINIKTQMSSQSGLPKLDFDSLMPDGTFLHTYFHEAKLDDWAEEYHFFNGLMVLSMLGGRRLSCLEFPYQQPNIFVCTVGHTATGKTATAGYMKEVVGRVLPYSPQDVNRNGVRVMKGVASGENMIDLFAGKIEENNVIKVDGHIKGLVIEDEMRGLSSRSGRDGNTLQDVINEMYSGGDAGTSSRSSGTVVAKSPYMSLATNVQPRILNKILSKSDSASGFLNRFFFVFPHEKNREWGTYTHQFDSSGPVAKAEEIKTWLNYHTPIDYDNPASHMRYISIEPEALFALQEFYKKELDYLRPSQPQGDDIFARCGAAMEKVVMLLAMNEMADKVGMDIAKRAMHIMLYLRRTWFMTNQHMATNETTEIEEWLQERFINYYQNCHADKREPKAQTVAQLYNRVGSSKYSKDELAQGFQRLERQGFIVKESEVKKGSKSRGYIINPEALEKG